MTVGELSLFSLTCWSSELTKPPLSFLFLCRYRVAPVLPFFSLIGFYLLDIAFCRLSSSKFGSLLSFFLFLPALLGPAHLFFPPYCGSPPIGDGKIDLPREPTMNFFFRPITIFLALFSSSLFFLPVKVGDERGFLFFVYGRRIGVFFPFSSGDGNFKAFLPPSLWCIFLTPSACLFCATDGVCCHFSFSFRTSIV